MGKVRVLVHLGPMKTGTSAFAAHLSRRNTAGTLPKHIIYPTDDLWFPSRGDIVKHHDLVEIAPVPMKESGERRRKTSVTPAMLSARFADIAAAARQRGGDVLVVMVCEIADQRATPELGRVLRQHFDVVDFVIVARDQSSAVRSLLGQQIRMWARKDVNRLDVREFARRHYERGSYDYARLWDKWAGKNRNYTLHFVPYRNGSGTDDLSQDIFDAVNLGEFPHSPDLLGGERIHSSFSEARMRELALIKRWAQSAAAIPGVLALGERLFNIVLRRAHAEIARRQSSGLASWKLSDADQDAVLDLYRESNEKFRLLVGKPASEPRWSAWFDKALGRTA
ncbi:MAG: hypothetical protein RLZZ319_194 [Actinomycetota bacterium]